MDRKIVHVVGTGTIGEPLIGILCEQKSNLGIDEVTFHKQSPLTKDAPKIKNLMAKGARLAVHEDRVESFDNLLQRYNGKEMKKGEYDFEQIQVINAGVRDPDAEGL